MSTERSTALVTGATSGIGRAVALALAESGRLVWAVGRNRSDLERLERGSESIRPVMADLTTTEGRSRVADEFESRALDVAIHAAGILGPPRTPLEEYPSSTWDEVFAINVSAVHFLHQAIAAALHRVERPTVIGVSSSVGRTARAGWGMYAVSKYALEGWLATLADEWGERGRVYSVNPGGTATPMRAAAAPEEDPASIPRPTDLVPLFLDLADPDCSYPSGTQFDAREYLQL